MKGHGNWTYGKHRSESGRKGRGENAFDAKEARSWKATLRRIERVVRKAQRAGAGTRKVQYLKLPLKAVRF